MLKKIKNKLRRFVRERELKKYYTNTEPLKLTGKTQLVLMLDGKTMHGGLVDRLKGIVSVKSLANQLGCDFKVHIAPGYFNLDEFLHINKEFYADDSEIYYNKKFVKPIFLNDIMYAEKESLLNVFSNNKLAQYHIYCNQDYLKLLNSYADKNVSSLAWGKEFHQLFSFDTYYTNFKNEIKGNENSCGIHLRFTSALGDFKDTAVHNLTEGEKINLINQCTEQVLKVITESKYNHYYIFSDSVTFLKHIKPIIINKDLARITIMDDGIGHVDMSDDEQVLKRTILDFYLLSTCNEIVQVKGPHMYNSNFSRYASYINDIKFTLDSFN